MARDRRASDDGARFGVVMSCIAVVLTVGAIWFALTR
jgi:hypothetical protein